MRKSLAIKTLLRSPLKTILTFALIAAATFALFSQVIGYSVTARETARAESFYSGVAALDNSAPDNSEEIKIGKTTYGILSNGEDRPWPEDEQIEQFVSLPGVTMADTRYMTAGLVEDYRRLIDPESSNELCYFLLEGTYTGYDKAGDTEDFIDLAFEDVTLLAGDLELDPQKPVIIKAFAVEDSDFYENPFPQAFFDELEKGSRCLVLGSYNGVYQSELMLDDSRGEQAFRVLDGVPKDYLETADFAFHKDMIQAIKQTTYTYDIVYTADMRAIPRFNERSMVITEGRPLQSEDTEGCVVSTLFMETHNLSLGDRISIQLGDKLFSQSSVAGATARDPDRISDFVSTTELEIIGVYRFTDTYWNRSSEMRWSYSVSTIFVPGTLLSVEVPADHEITAGEFSVFVENARDIEAFFTAGEPFAQELGLGLRFSDGGWLGLKDSFEAGTRTSFLTTILYLAGAALALFMAVYLYISGSKKTYGIMRTQGVTVRQARGAVILPLGVLSAPAILAGGVTGILHGSAMTTETLASMAAVTADSTGYALSAALPIGTVSLCLVGELVFISFITILFLNKIRWIPLLELLQGQAIRAGRHAEPAEAPDASSAAVAQRKITTPAEGQEMPRGGRYNALRQVTAYIFRHMRRGIGKTAVSLILVAVLGAGIGLFVLTRLAYQDAFHETRVNVRALEFTSTAAASLSKSDLVKDFYCYGTFNVIINNRQHDQPIILTNDPDRYIGNHTVTYAEGYDDSFITGSGQLCLLGQMAAEAYEVNPGDEIALIPQELYSFLVRTFKDEEKFQRALERAATMYKIAGIIESDDMNTSNGIFAAPNSAAEDLNGQPYAMQCCEFTLADNERLDELNSLLDQQKKLSEQHSRTASFHVDAEGLVNIGRVRDLLNLLFPAAVAAVVLIGVFGPGLMIIQSAREAASLRILGVTKRRVRCMLVFEQIILCVFGMALVAGGLALYNGGLFARSGELLALCGALYLLGCICGALGAAVLVTRRRALELLQVKE